MSDPVLHIVAGPNGSGKTTLFRQMIEPVTALEWINADDIAADLDSGDDQAIAYEAAQQAAGRRAELIADGRSFATGTVFSHASKVELVRYAVDAGYLVTLHVVAVTEDLAVARVESRVTYGGHAVPEEKIRARYEGLWAHVGEAVAVAHETYVYDNTNASRPFQVIAKFEAGQAVGQAEWPDWAPAELRALG
jgi:predicted ABC-type ATPase